MVNRDQQLGMSIGRAIAKYRVLAGLTQAQVAEILGVTNEAVSRMERGTIMPTVARLIRLAEIFGCDVVELLMESSPLVYDQSKRIALLLGELDEEERMELVVIWENMVRWYLKSKER